MDIFYTWSNLKKKEKKLRGDFGENPWSTLLSDWLAFQNWIDLRRKTDYWSWFNFCGFDSFHFNVEYVILFIIKKKWHGSFQLLFDVSHLFVLRTD